MESLIEHYGYWGILLGSFLQGETILILGSFAAHQGYLELPRVILCAFAGTLLSDQLLFFLGAQHSQALLKRCPTWTPRIGKLHQQISRHKIPIILAFRFWYGFRFITPFALGMSKVPWLAFIFFNIFGAILWAVVIGYAGYLFGHALSIILGKLKHFEALVLAGLALLGATIWLIRLYKNRQLKPPPEQKGPPST
jgi:membrane protein DedA with SNARE-associated domain